MKKVSPLLFIAPVLLFSCTASKPVVIDNASLFKAHQPPYKIFSIGNWQKGYSIVTLTDATHDYFTIKTVQNNTMKIGETYDPKTL